MQSLKQLSVIEFKGQRVLTTQQLAVCYETTRHIISNNFTRNKARYDVGKHYVPLEGAQLQDFKRCHQFDDSMKKVSILYLWTEKGALLHAKSLNTDKAWEVYDYLVDFYFSVKSEQKAIPAVHTKEPLKTEKEPYDIAPLFRDLITKLPLEALDALEKSLRSGTSKAVKLAGMSILVEKMKRQMI